ncbi:Uncharacterised protein [uncultured archaeon]|nr:Uncharacterised protein [uncultured archaeon]
MFKRNQKGELTTAQIVALIILVLSFAVIIIFLSRLNLQEDSKREICKASVILSGKDPVSKNPNCETNYVCITRGEACTDIKADETIKILPGDERKQILSALANELSDCWMMFGEGNVKYVQNSVSGSYSYHCAVCSIIKFGDSLNSISITKDDLTLYLELEKKDASQTYASYLYSTNTVEDALSSKGRMYPIPDLDLKKKYAIITGINPDLEWFGFQKSSPVHPSIIAVEDIPSTPGVCDLFDVTKG